jgi:hypothetical protein
MPIRLTQPEISPSTHTVNKPAMISPTGAGGKPLAQLYRRADHILPSLEESSYYRSTGIEALDTLAFLHLLERLKVCPLPGPDIGG